MRYTYEMAEYEHIISCAKAMVAAARTAPKGRGIDHLETLILTDSEKERFLDAAEKNAALLENDKIRASLLRDIGNCRKASAVVFLGGRAEVSGINDGSCTYCSYGSCKECLRQDGFCSFMVGDLGIACGSAVSVAADMRVDNRIMYTVGREARNLQIFEKPVKLAFAIPLSVSRKSVFFDR